MRHTDWKSSASRPAKPVLGITFIAITVWFLSLLESLTGGWLTLIFNREEVVLLVRNSAEFFLRCFVRRKGTDKVLYPDLATLVDDVRAHPPTTRSQADSYEAMRNKAIEAQQTETARRDEEKKAEMQLVYKDKIIKKIQDKQALALARGKPPLLGDEQDTGIKVVEPGQDTAWTEPPLPPPKPRDLSAIPYIIVIQPSSTDAPWYNPSAATYTTLAAAREAQVWNYPSTKLEEARCKVFEDLWKKGHFMGGGLRFGGDFLIYPGTLLPLCGVKARALMLPYFGTNFRGSIALPLSFYSHCHSFSRYTHHATRFGRLW